MTILKVVMFGLQYFLAIIFLFSILLDGAAWNFSPSWYQNKQKNCKSFLFASLHSKFFLHWIIFQLFWSTESFTLCLFKTFGWKDFIGAPSYGISICNKECDSSSSISTVFAPIIKTPPKKYTIKRRQFYDYSLLG